MLILNFFNNKFYCDKIIQLIWFFEYWFLGQQFTMLYAKHLCNQVIKCKYVLKQYPVFKLFFNKFTYNFVSNFIHYILIIQFWHSTSVNVRMQLTSQSFAFVDVVILVSLILLWHHKSYRMSLSLSACTVWSY